MKIQGIWISPLFSGKTLKWRQIFQHSFVLGPRQLSGKEECRSSSPRDPPLTEGRRSIANTPVNLLGQHHSTVSQWLLLLQLLRTASKMHRNSGLLFKHRKTHTTKTRGQHHTIALYLFPELM